MTEQELQTIEVELETQYWPATARTWVRQLLAEMRHLQRQVHEAAGWAEEVAWLRQQLRQLLRDEQEERT